MINETKRVIGELENKYQVQAAKWLALLERDQFVKTTDVHIAKKRLDELSERLEELRTLLVTLEEIKR